MENRQYRTVAAFQNVLTFLDLHPITPEPPLLAGMRKSLQASIERISKNAVTQKTAMALRQSDVEHLRRQLRRARLMPLVRIAKPLLAFAPGTERVLVVPHARDNAQTVAAAALKIADALQPHHKLLTSAGCSRTFLTELRAEARQLALAAKRTDAARQEQARATNAIAAEFRKAMKAVTVIEGLVMLHYAEVPSKIALWRNRRRVSRRIGRPSKASIARRSASRQPADESPAPAPLPS